MKKHDVFEFIAPNGVVVTGVVVAELLVNQIRENCFEMTYLCYAQNRLFLATSKMLCFEFSGPHLDSNVEVGSTVVEYIVIPKYDKVLEDYWR